MGDGQFEGGGSVKWEVTNSDGEYGGGDKEKCKGKDKDPKHSDGKFRVLLNGQLQFEVPVEKNTIRVEWDSDSSEAAKSKK
jgi:hypothetical protein